MSDRIVILGSGTGGTMTANLVARELPRARVTVIGETRAHVFQPGNLDVAFKGAPPEKYTRPEPPLLRKRVEFLRAAAARVDTRAKSVILRAGDAVPYDTLVLATGALPRPDIIPGLREGALNFHTGPHDAALVWDAIESFEGGKIVVAIGGVPYKCPPSPNEAAFMLDDHFRARRMRDKVDIKLVTPYPHAYPASTIAEIVEPRLQRRGIGVVPFFNLDRVDPEKKRIVSLEGEEVPYDLLIAIPPHRGAQVIVDSGLGDEEGWIPTDKETMRVKGHDDVYALGDATNIPISKSGVVAHLQSEVVARNIVLDRVGSREELAFNGRINCPMEVGRGRALFVSATYASPPKRLRPTRVRYAMKRSFARIYWGALKGRYDALFRAYFGPTSHAKPRG